MKKWIPLIVFIVLIGAAVAAIVSHKEQPGKYDAFAQCIADSGTTFYGAFWCPHCAATKALFGSSAKYLPYTECSTPDGKSQLQICTDAGVEGYPTWVFPDQSRLSGEQTLETIAQKTGCTLPQ